jgi:hypothetical protein
MQCLYHEGQILYFGFDEVGSGGLLVQLVFIADERVGACDQHCRVEDRQDDDLEGAVSDAELWREEAADLTEEIGFGGTDGRQLQDGRIGKEQPLFFEVVIDCISYHCNKN